MKRLVKLVVFLLVAGGWPLALSAICVVRTPGELPMVGSDYGSVHIFTKDHLSFRQTFADTRQWTPDDVTARPDLVARMNALGLGDLAKATVFFDPNAPVDPKAAWKTGMPPIENAQPQPATARSLVIPSDVPQSAPRGSDITPHAVHVPASQPEHQKSIFDN